MNETQEIEQSKLLKLDLGCGPNLIAPDWTGVDQYEFPGVTHVCDLNGIWPFEDGTVDEARASHVVEHFDAKGRCHFFNELYRVLKTGAKCIISVPNWASFRAYGDPTHRWPPMADFMVLYLNKAWRMSQAPHTDRSRLEWGYDCNFSETHGFTMIPDITVLSDEPRAYRMTHEINTSPDIVITIMKEPTPTPE